MMNQPSNALASFPSIGFWSHPGKVRAENEDRFYVPPANLPPQVLAAKGYLCVVADGMGGHAKGAVASEMATRRIAEVYYADSDPNPETALRRAIQTANADVFVASQNPGMEGMGTTIVACAVVNGRTIVANVGDSRAYLISRRQAIQITHDHSVVQNLVDSGIITPEQAEQHPDRNRILRAIGVKPSVDVDLFTPATEPGDLIVLCSDGLSNLVRKEEIAQIASSTPPQNAAKQLVALANERGGHDNITVVILPAAAGARQAYRQPTRASALIPVMAGAMLFLILGVFAVAAFLANQARPTPASVANIPAPTSTPVATAVIPAPTALPPATATRAVSPTPQPTSTHTPTHTATPTPTIPRGEVVYLVQSGDTLTKLISGLGIPSDATTFYNRHPELWCTPAGGNINCIKPGNLFLKWEELDPALGLSAAPSQSGKWLWMAVLVDDEILRTRGLENLAPHKGKPVLIRGMWKDGAWVDDPKVNVMFVWYPQSNRYGEVGHAAPPVATPVPTPNAKEPIKEVPLEPQSPPEPPKPPPPEPPKPPSPPEP